MNQKSGHKTSMRNNETWIVFVECVKVELEIEVEREKRNGCLDSRNQCHPPSNGIGPPLSPPAGLNFISRLLVDNAFTHDDMVGERIMNSRSAPAVPPTMHAAVYPTKRPQEISVQGFRISTQKLPILKADPIEEMTRKLGIAPPEMIFGDNYVMIEHEKSGWGINFNSFDALDRVDKTGQSMLQVAYSKEWQKSRYRNIALQYSTIKLGAYFPYFLMFRNQQGENT